jgi:anti-repressor protein
MTGTDLTPFDFRGTRVRVVSIDGEPWFVAADVCFVLGYSNSRDAVSKHVRDTQRGVSRIATPSGDQDMTVVNEGGLYRLLMRARTVLADDFQDWVTDDVLPTIRKTGGYGNQFEIPATFPEALELAARQARQLEAAEARNTELEPVAASWTQLADATGDYSLREAAQILDRDPAIQTGQNRLAKTLKNVGWTDRNGQPYQRYVDLGRLVIRTRSYDHPITGESQATTQVRVTVKGIHALHRLLGGTGAVLLEVAS